MALNTPLYKQCSVFRCIYQTDHFGSRRYPFQILGWMRLTDGKGSRPALELILPPQCDLSNKEVQGLATPAVSPAPTCT